MATENVKIIISAKDQTKRAFGTASTGLSGLKGSAKSLVGAFIGPLGLVAAVAALTAGIGKGIKATADFESQLSNISTLITGDSTVAINDLRTGIRELLKETPKSADELGAAAYDIVSAGISDTGEALKVLRSSSRLAVAGLGTTQEATDLLTSALNAFGKDASESEAVAEILFNTVKAGKTTVSQLAQSFGNVAPLAKTAGISLEDLQAATAALTTSGLKTSVAQSSIRTAINSLLKPTADMTRAFKILGVTSGIELIESSENMVDAFGKVQDALGNNIEATGKAFGSVEALNAVLSLGGAQNESYQATIESMTNSQGLMSEAVDKQNEQFNAQWQLLKNQVNVEFQKLAIKILPILIKIMEVLPDIINRGLVQPFKTVFNVISSVIDVVQKAIAAIDRLIQKAKQAFSGTVGRFVGSVAGSVKNVAGALGFDHGGVVPGPIGQAVPAIVHGGETILPTHKKGLAGIGGVTINVNNPVLLDDSMLEKLSIELGRLLRNDIRF
tara:strand:+ start:1947 stop:3455 length:1509 start_codon:yes stop_codon:yes gene_type:complete